MAAIDCPECRIVLDADPEIDEAYCPWCGARSPEPFEALAMAELKVLEELTGGFSADQSWA